MVALALADLRRRGSLTRRSRIIATAKGPSATFRFGAVCAALGAVILVTFVPDRRATA